MKYLKQNAGCIILVYSMGTKATRLKAAVHYCTLHTPYLAEI